MNKALLAIALCILPVVGFAAQTPVTIIEKFNNPATSINTLREATNIKLGVIETNRQDHVANIATKVDKAQAVRYWADHPDNTEIPAGTILAYNGKLYAAKQAFNKVSTSATPDVLTVYFEVASGSGGTNDYNDLINTPTIPTALADLATDSTHRVVTDAEKEIWNAGGSDDQIAAEVTVADAGSYFVGINVEAVLQEIGAYPTLVFGTGLTTSTSGGTDTISVTANTYQPYDADLLLWALISPSTGSINTSGAVQARVPFNSYASSQTLASSTHNSTVVQLTVAGEATMWDCGATNIGDTVMLWARDSEKIEIVPFSGDHFVLFNGTAITADYELDMAATAGTKVTLMCTSTDTWSVYSETSESTDGGAAD